MYSLTLSLGRRELAVPVEAAIIAGWTGRERSAVEAHIGELEALGVPRPSRVPVFYRVSAARLTTGREIEAPPTSSGEAEPVLLRHEGRLWVGVGSDHTDRQTETYSVAVAKQMCDKPMAPEFWAYPDVAGHWDRLWARSFILESGREILYQEGTLDGLLPAPTLIELAEPALRDGTAMFCGTFPAHGGIRSAPAFRYELHDPVLGRSISSSYITRVLPIVT